MLTHEEIIHLTPPERLTLIAELWDSLTEEETPLAVSQSQELQRRITSFEHDRPNAVSWEYLKAEMSKRAP